MFKVNAFATAALRSASLSADEVRKIACTLENTEDKCFLLRLAGDLDAFKGAAAELAGDEVAKEDITPLTDVIAESGLDIEKLKKLPFYEDLVLAYKQNTFTIPEILEFMTVHSTSDPEGAQSLQKALQKDEK